MLTEHRQFDNESDYSELGKKFGLTILKGAEVETEYGHVLVFGVTPALQQAFDFTNIHLALADVVSACKAHNAVAVPCHPGRKRVGMSAHLEEFGVPEGVVETMKTKYLSTWRSDLAIGALAAATLTLSVTSAAAAPASSNPSTTSKTLLAPYSKELLRR